jgi:hypothetical protein
MWMLAWKRWASTTRYGRHCHAVAGHDRAPFSTRRQERYNNSHRKAVALCTSSSAPRQFPRLHRRRATRAARRRRPRQIGASVRFPSSPLLSAPWSRQLRSQSRHPRACVRSITGPCCRAHQASATRSHCPQTATFNGAKSAVGSAWLVRCWCPGRNRPLAHYRGSGRIP